MPEFHNTGYGRNFFEGQLPQLIATLDRIADALEKITVIEQGEEPEDGNGCVPPGR